MKTILSTHLTALVLLSSFILHPSSLFGQGSLTPPGAPGPTMKTLDQLDAKLEKRTPITSIPVTITNSGSYYLTTNMIATAANPGITISTNNVTLDLNGFTLQGVPTAGTAVYMPNACTNVTVRNGVLTGWSNNGVYGPSAYNLLCERLTVSSIANYGIYCGGGGTVRDCVVEGGGLPSLTVNNGIVAGCIVKCGSQHGICATNSTVSGCTVTGPFGNYGIYAWYSTVSDCTVVGTYWGINADHSTILGCGVQSCNSWGIYASYSTVSGCFVRGCYLSGIWVAYPGPGCQIIGNNLIGNNTAASSSHAGIFVADNNNRIENNHVTASGYAGILIYANCAGNVVIRNTVSGTSGGSNYATNTSSAFGPIISTSGTITNLNPCANFSY